MDPYLEPAVELIRERVERERSARERIGLDTASAVPIPTWITRSKDPYTIPILALADETNDGYLLAQYFRRTIPEYAMSEAESLALLEHPNGLDHETQAFAEAGQGARRRFDLEAAVRSIDMPRFLEEHQHDSSPYGQSIADLYETYQAAKRTCTNETRDTHVELALELGAELVASNAVRRERLNTIAAHFGSDHLTSRSSSVRIGILIDIARIGRIPFILTDTSIMIPDDSHTLTNAADLFEETDKRYSRTAREAITRALTRDPGLIAHADTYARTPSAWIQSIL
ncbi:MAG: hypothetical protein ACMXYM_02945 [Candidatus Woesearchaeota archaeon]